MLVRRIAARPDVERIIGIDKEPRPDILDDVDILTYLEINTAEAWEEEARQHHPDIVIHTAWQIRPIYGNKELSWKWNIDGSDKIFDFAFEEESVKKLVYFSSVSSYGAFAENEIDHFFTEDEPFRKTQYLYAEEKRIAEEHLNAKYQHAAANGNTTIVSIVRPAAITGPRGRFMRIRFGLQAALAGQLKGSLIYRLISSMVSFVPVTPKWLRQFIHEDDVVNIIEKLAFDDVSWQYEAFNICPPGKPVLGDDMAKAVGKKTLPMPAWMVRIPFFWFWHLTRGRVPTSPGAWKGYSYPIAVDGSKLTRLLGYEYMYSSFDAFYYTDGEYEPYVPVEQRRSI
ncbi:NAD-dependent epimerase/dehydratase family protein [Patescibacteria group bacterium]|nr:NAD-dependent epimerase/dehydratase family protein [Patescibacteria group bacterium]MBU1755041.1 NAD-dependent epimerase/dehydratase family protein [Patescibacteria group bacterium]